MICDKCKKKNATFHSKTIINGIEKEEHLCYDCARSIHGDVFSFGTISDDLFDDFMNIGNTFSIPFDSYIPNNNYKSSGHSLISDANNLINIGAKKVNIIDENKRKELYNLQEKFDKAIEIEDYESASELKKKIRELKGEQGNV